MREKIIVETTRDFDLQKLYRRGRRRYIKYRQIMFRIIILVFTIVLAISCNVIRTKDSTIYEMSGLKYTGINESVSVFAHLNDTIFSYDDIINHLDYLRQKISPGSEFPRPESYPLLRIDLINVSKTSIKIPLPNENLTFPHCYPHYPYVAIGTGMNSVGKIKTEELLLFGDIHEPTDSDYALIMPNDTMVINYKYDVLLYAGVEEISEGDYWIVFKYVSCWNKNDSIPIWFGRTVSDTLYFTIYR